MPNDKWWSITYWNALSQNRLVSQFAIKRNHHLQVTLNGYCKALLMLFAIILSKTKLPAAGSSASNDNTITRAASRANPETHYNQGVPVYLQRAAQCTKCALLSAAQQRQQPVAQSINHRCKRGNPISRAREIPDPRDIKVKAAARQCATAPAPRLHTHTHTHCSSEGGLIFIEGGGGHSLQQPISRWPRASRLSGLSALYPA